MNLVLLGMQQSRTTSAAGKIHGMIARPKHGRSLQKDTGCRRDDYLEADLTNGHNVLPLRRREHYRTLSHRRPAGGAVDDAQYIGIGRHIGH
jgi:hypothetical protein